MKTKEIDDILLRLCTKWTKGRILSSPRKVTSQSLRTIEALHLVFLLQVFNFNTLLLSCIRPKADNILGKNQKLINNIPNWDYPSNHRRSTWKNLKATLLFINLSKAFDFIHRRKMEKILQLCGLNNFFDIVPSVLLGNTLVLFIICIDYVLLTSIDLMNESDFSF